MKTMSTTVRAAGTPSSGLSPVVTEQRATTALLAFPRTRPSSVATGTANGTAGTTGIAAHADAATVKDPRPRDARPV